MKNSNETQIVTVVDPALDSTPIIGEGRYADCPWPCCSTCGQPDGECYRICPEHPEYYSAEQERADEPWYAEQCRQDRITELLEEHADKFAEWLETPRRHWTSAPVHPCVTGAVVIDPSDIPF